MIPLGVLAQRQSTAGGGGTLAVTYVTTVSSATDLTTYTFAGTSIGAPAADRTLVIAAMGRGSAALTSIDVSVGGSPATADRVIYASAQNGCGLFHIPYPSGTTADIAVTFSHTRWGAAAHIYSVTGGTLAVADSDAAQFGSATVGPLTVDATAGGAVIATSLHGTTSGDATWTGVSEDYEGTYGSALRGSGGHAHTSTAGPVTVTAEVAAPYLPILAAVAYSAA